MALGKYSRVDGRKSTNYCSSITFVVFVGVCLVGVWMMTSSSMVPVKDVVDTSEKSESEDATKGDNSVVDTQTGTTENAKDSDDKKTDKSEESKDSNEAKGQNEEKKSEETPVEKKEVFPSGAQSELLKETLTQDGAWKTQAAESKKETSESSESDQKIGFSWKVCNVTAGPDYIPCLDNLQAIKNLRSTKHYEHRERHCPDDPPTCLVSLPEGYQRSIVWPTSREKIWYHNVPHTKLAEVKGHQNWVKVDGEYLTFPGGGTQFKHDALHYIDFIQQVTNFLVTLILDLHSIILHI
ncbi:Methyltransferase [Heracleum sosnowskyi]|uniref:Methyltransferase n=1 Tax=Heracleum sosnowskyi TaxID=360622 RepID=A0AAD8JF96_9APIA|nr:Methyltransferase [Heracleum sosnowskyi]